MWSIGKQSFRGSDRHIKLVAGIALLLFAVCTVWMLEHPAPATAQPDPSHSAERFLPSLPMPTQALTDEAAWTLSHRRALPHTRLQLGSEIFNLEVATTKADAQNGLMFRTHLPEGTGMLFPFSPPRRVSFWMKNTLIPLDMIFIRHGQIVHIEKNVPPCDESVTDRCPTYSSIWEVDTVVEVPAGTSQRLGLHLGDIVTRPRQNAQTPSASIQPTKGNNVP